MGLRDLLDLVLPLECASCRRPGTRWCARCARALAGLALAGTAHPGAVEVHPDPVPPGLPPVHAWGAYSEPLSTAIRAWKDAGRRDLAVLLAARLAVAVGASLTAAELYRGWPRGPVLVVPAPSSRASARLRGDVPLQGVARLVAADRGACRNGPLRVVPALVHTRGVEDQSGLDTRGRRANVSGSMTVKSLWHSVVRGRRCVLVDDVMTTGSTLAEASRALRVAGAADVVGATVAATQRRPVGHRRGADRASTGGRCDVSVGSPDAFPRPSRPQ